MRLHFRSLRRDVRAMRVPSCGTALNAPRQAAKRAETRECPMCHEPIPLRLLGQHVQLESERVQNILDHVGDLAEFADPYATNMSAEYASLALDTLKIAALNTLSQAAVAQTFFDQTSSPTCYILGQYNEGLARRTEAPTCA